MISAFPYTPLANVGANNKQHTVGAYKRIISVTESGFWVRPEHGLVRKAGLLIPLAGGTCDIHPTAKGHELIATAIESAMPR